MVRKGSYILLIDLSSAQQIKVGSLGTVDFPSGYYAYVGSAMRGFKSRLTHHRRESKKPHWHIDYLLQRATISNILIFESKKRNECTIAKSFESCFTPVLGIGCSDCRCKSHLFYTLDEAALESRIANPKFSRDKELEWIENVPTSYFNIGCFMCKCG